MRASAVFLVVMATMVTADETVFSCEDCPKSPDGPKGVRGGMGLPGPAGDSGDPGKVYYRGSLSQCGSEPCPPGVPGDKGDIGFVGENGQPGDPGMNGEKGLRGEPGDPGKPGRPGTDDIMYLPYKPSDNVRHVCYSFRKSCLVPGLRNGWRGWYREGQSGYMIYNKWMYFVTLSNCPCTYDEPSAPQPAKPNDCVRLGECQE